MRVWLAAVSAMVVAATIYYWIGISFVAKGGEMVDEVMLPARALFALLLAGTKSRNVFLLSIAGCVLAFSLAAFVMFWQQGLPSRIGYLGSVGVCFARGFADTLGVMAVALIFRKYQKPTAALE